jgi:tetratricopeptide (TPR) repeat protein
MSAVDKAGDRDEVHLNLGNCFRANGDYAAALDHYRLALDLAPDYHEAKAAIDDISNMLGLTQRFKNVGGSDGRERP